MGSIVKKLTCLGGFLVCVCMFMCFCLCMWQHEDAVCMYLCKPEVGIVFHRSIQLDCFTSMPQDSQHASGFSCLCLHSPGITGVVHHAQLFLCGYCDLNSDQQQTVYQLSYIFSSVLVFWDSALSYSPGWLWIFISVFALLKLTWANSSSPFLWKLFEFFVCICVYTHMHVSPPKSRESCGARVTWLWAVSFPKCVKFPLLT